MELTLRKGLIRCCPIKIQASFISQDQVAGLGQVQSFSLTSNKNMCKLNVEST